MAELPAKAFSRKKTHLPKLEDRKIPGSKNLFPWLKTRRSW